MPPCISVGALRERFPQWKCCSSEEKGILVVGSQEIPQSHPAQQTSHKMVAASARERSRGKLSRRQAHIGFPEGSGKSRVGIGGFLSSGIGVFGGFSNQEVS